MDVPALHRWLSRLAVALATIFVLLAVIGIVRSYSPVPYWDSWDGYLAFFLDVRSGDPWAWLAFHGEHRIVLTRLVFYADLAWAQGRGIAPLVTTCLVALTGATLFCKAIGHVARDRPRHERIAAGSLVFGLMFFWSQEENFTWAFQTQFLLSTVVPLAALYLSACSTGEKHRDLYFVSAATLGFAALGTMANGVFALPALVFHAVAVGMSRRRIGTLVVLCVISIGVSRLGFVPVPRHDSPVDALLSHPFGVLTFVVTYLGSPFASIFDEGTLQDFAILAGGACSLILAAVSLVRVWPVRKAEPMQMAMVALTAFLLATALATAAGRLGMGLDTALSSRYTTVALTMGCALLVTFIAPRHDEPPRCPWAVPLIVAALLVLLPGQLDALHHGTQFAKARAQGALALELQVDDSRAIHNVYPGPPRALAVARAARDQGLSVFGFAPLGGVHSLIGSPLAAATVATCHGQVLSSEVIGEGIDFVRVTGSLNDPPPPEISGVLIADDHDTIVGYALSRPRRSGTREHPGSAAAAFDGYVSKAAIRPDGNTHLRACLDRHAQND